jgi:hypothetical protein
MKINGSTLSGVSPGSGFREALLAPVPLKDFIENDSALENGTQVIIPQNPMKKARDLTLEFQVVGSTVVEFNTRKNALFEEFYKGTFVLSELGFTTEVFHLVYLGKSPTYASGPAGRACKVSVGFREYDPTNRTADSQ